VTVVDGGASYALGLLVRWLGWPAVLAWAAGVGVALWRRERPDLVLVAFLVPAFLAAAAIPWLDERFLVYLVPPVVVLLARLLVELGDRAAGRRLARIAVGLVVLALLAGDLGRSAWQNVLLSLPDTRALAGRWFEAHIPRTARVGVEGYFPVGLDAWLHASFFEPRKPLRDALAATDVLVTSSLEHGRYLERGEKYQPVLAEFFRALAEERAPMRTFALATRGFAHSVVTVYATRPPRVPEAPTLVLPRPYDHTWNGGVAFLDPGPYDRDDRTVLLGGAQDHDATLVAPAGTDEVAVFVANGPEPGRIRVQVGWRTRHRRLRPDAWHVFHFRPRWWWPGRPALYRFRAGLLREGQSALVQVRAGPREIGEAYAAWGRWAEAVPYLERAAAGRRGDAELLLRLGTVYRQLGRAEDARRVAAQLETEAPGYRAVVGQLAQGAERPEAWTETFERLTGLDRGLLTAALARDVRVEAILAQGRLAGDPEAPGGVSVVFERGVDAPGLVVNGPRRPRPLVYLAPGAYRARFTLHGGAAAAGGESAVLRVFAERRLLAARPVTGGELGDGRRAVEVVVPFVHDGPPAPMAVQVEATGRGSFRIDRVRVEPDLPEAFRQRQRDLAALAG
jgi:tetratricopeptide (TPR) repeat protein